MDLLLKVIVFLILIQDLNNINMAVVRTAALVTPESHYFSDTTEVLAWRETECYDTGVY